jgi:hypothetical protein
METDLLKLVAFGSAFFLITVSIIFANFTFIPTAFSQVGNATQPRGQDENGGGGTDNPDPNGGGGTDNPDPNGGGGTDNPDPNGGGGTDTLLPEDSNTRSNDGTTTTIPESATTTDLLSSDPTNVNLWQSHNNSYHGFKINYLSNWTFTNSTTASSNEPYVAAQFCPTEPGFLGVSSQCQTGIEGQANDQIWIKVYPSLTMHYQFSGDNATMLVEQFMHQDMNRSRTASGWQSYEVINRTTTTINATDESSITQTRIVSIPAIIVDYRHSQGANDFRNVEMYTIFAGKGYVLQYLPRTSIELIGDNVQENAQGFYSPIIEDIFMTFSPIRSLQ